MGYNTYSSAMCAAGAFDESPVAGLETPVVLIVFNRPSNTRRVFDAIRRVRPKTMLVIGDGARPDRTGETDRVAAVRAIVAEIDWPCFVQTNFSDANLGCRRRISSGLDWAFSKVDRAIVLEDDCLPSPSFFRFCQDMLTLYRDDRRVYSISGSNFSGSLTGEGHYFSAYAMMWGWATWADRWSDYRVDPDDVKAVLLRRWGRQPKRFAYWSKIFSNLARQRMDAWDYQWILTLWRHSALAVRPPVNLIQNIGFGADATHTTVATTPLAEFEAITTSADFKPHGPFIEDARQDAFDERLWAHLDWRSILLMHAPWLSRSARARFRTSMGLGSVRLPE